MASSEATNSSWWEELELDEEDRIGFEAASALIRTAAATVNRIDQILKPFELTFARFEVLLLLSWTHSGSMTLRRMRDRLLVHQAAVTSVVDRLERDGLVQRLPHPRDRRTTLAEITGEGHTIVAQATQRLGRELHLGVSDEEALEILSLVQLIRRSAGEID